MDVGNGVWIRWRDNWASYFRAAGSRRVWASCMAINQNCYHIGSWLIFSFAGKNFFSFLPLSVHLLQKEESCCCFLPQQNSHFSVSGYKIVKWTFIQCALLPFLPGEVEGFFLQHWATLACSCHWELLLSIKTCYCCGTLLSPTILSMIMGYSAD